ncbi:MAG: hypothetical protein ACLUAL_19205 [Blautia wexlerae]
MMRLRPDYTKSTMTNCFQLFLNWQKKLNVQLFIATHSMEAIDAILAYGKYDEENDNDPIKVITLKKVSSKERKGK